MAKEVLRLETPERIPEVVARAFRVAESGRRGPVVLEMPEDVLTAAVEAEPWPRLEPVAPAADPADVAAVEDLLASAQRPLIVVGRGPWSEQARQDLDAAATRRGIPVLAAFRCQDYIGTESASYAGHLAFTIDPALHDLAAGADLVLAIGGQLGDVDTQGYTLWSDPDSCPRFVHVVPDPVQANRHLPTQRVVLASGPAFVRALAQLEPGPAADPDRLELVRAAQVARSTPTQDDLLSGVLGFLREELPADAVLCNGAGNYAVWVHRYGRYPRFGTQLAPASGAMGYGLPAGTMASLLDQDRPVVIFGGDGCLLMSIQELATIAEHGLTPVVIAVNNGIYGTIRMHQEKTYPGRVSGTHVNGPDFVALARSFGWEAHRAQTRAEFVEAWRTGTDSGRATLIELPTDPGLLAPGLRL